jgi:hypothetical protein
MFIGLLGFIELLGFIGFVGLKGPGFISFHWTLSVRCWTFVGFVEFIGSVGLTAVLTWSIMTE